MPFVLIAGIEDWMPIIVPVVSIAVFLLNQLFDKSSQQKNQTTSRRPQYNQQPEEDEDDEVTRMVREATARSRERADRGRRPSAPASRPREDWRTRGEVVEAEIVEERRPAPRTASPRPAAGRTPSVGGSVAAHVDQYLGEHERQFSKSVETTVSTDDIRSRLDDEVHAKFDHSVGTMDDKFTANRPTGNEPGADTSLAQQGPLPDLVSQLFSPDNFRQAFILQEILDPPSR